MNERFILNHERARRMALYAVEAAPLGYVCEIKERTRTADQNALMWAMLSDVADQVNWHGSKLSKEEWKCVFSAALKKQKVVPGIDSGFVVIGQSTSKMTKSEMSDLVELINAFGANHNVKFRASRDLETNS